MDITISTTYFNSSALPFAAESVVRQAFSGRFEYIVVDNASQIQSYLVDAKTRAPSMTVIVNSSNSGFSSANNAALNMAKGKYFLLMNPDIVLGKNTLQLMFDFMEQNEGVVAAGCKIVDGEGRVLPSRRRFPTPLTVVSRFAPDFTYFQRQIEKYEMTDANPAEILDVDWLSGGFLFCRTEILRKVGGLDERYFLYFEDVDLCRRLHPFGRIVFLPHIQCQHSTRHASRRNLRLFLLHVIASMKYFHKWGVQSPTFPQ